MVPGCEGKVCEGNERGGEGTERSVHQPRREAHADHEPDAEETGHISAGMGAIFVVFNMMANGFV